MGIFGFFGKKGANIKKELKKVENRDLMQAIAGGSLLVAYADGECSQEEVDKMEAIIVSLPELAHFSGELSQTIDYFRKQFEASYRVGRQKVLKELDDIQASDDDKELVFNIMVTIAEADGEIGEKEFVVLKDVAQRLGVNLRDYGLENA